MMRIAEYTPQAGLLYRDATQEEEAEAERLRDEEPAPELTPEERMEQIEAALIELAAMMAGGDV